MKKVLFFLIVLCSSIGVQSQVRITEVMSNGGPTDWFELTNFGSSTVDITGWKMDDNSFAFANSVLLNGITSIATGERVIFGESGYCKNHRCNRKNSNRELYYSSQSSNEFWCFYSFNRFLFPRKYWRRHHFQRTICSWKLEFWQVDFYFLTFGLNKQRIFAKWKREELE